MSKINHGLLSSNTDQWATPQTFFDSLNAEFNFTLDPCADAINAKCEKFYTRDQDGLAKNWDGERVFCNPPYGKEIGKWVKKCSEIAGGGELIGNAYPCENRHKMVPRIHIQQGGNKIYQRQAQVRRQQKLCTVPEYGRNFQK